ncbi:hypothetical protein [Roseimaritima sediminicola]|uniref:hypothetical protein n=1 Tax=Roseimaritima sediminicola TaxID=2662066 RepID=UPI0012985292|nr:hypothetical protein [Roseimaritima sediminicola]
MNFSQPIRRRLDVCRKHRRRPRGVILLLVLGMLALFSLLTATYVIFTSQSRLASYTISQRNTRGAQPEALLDQAITSVLVGSNSSESAVWGSSLLRDKWGSDFIEANVRDANAYGAAGQPGWVVQDHFYRIQTSLAPEVDDTTKTAAEKAAARQRDGVDVDDLLVGRYFTLKEGPLSHLTFRIVRSFRDRTGETGHPRALDRILVLDVGPYLDERISHEGRMQSLRWWLDSGSTRARSLFYGKGQNQVWGGGGTFTAAGAAGSDDEGLPFLITGRARNGYGYGWQNTGSGFNLDETVSITNGSETLTVPVALLPNYSTYRVGMGLPPGDGDEPFDVPDYRDMFLAHFPQNPSGVPNALGPAAPSFVRPALINYIVSYYDQSLTSLNQDQLRNVLSMLIRSTMRPLPIANAPEYGGGHLYRSYTGGGEGHNAFSKAINYLNPNANDVRDLALALATGPWDVDNDGDGVNDSVFIDAGMPLVTMADGTLVQPMAAFRIEDLSGRVNLNTAGSLATMQVPSLAYETNTAASVNNVYARAPVGGPLNDAATTIGVIQGGGFGYGPAEIDPRALHGGTITAASSDWAKILRERYGNASDGVPGTGNHAASHVDEMIGSLRRPNRPLMHAYGAAYGMPKDVWGRGRIAVDPTGAPLISGLANTVYLDGDATADGNEIVNDPYEGALRRQGRGDNEFTLAEFEPVIRAWDWDRQQLPQRLVEQLSPIVSSGVPTQDLYRMVTPISSSDDVLPAQPADEESDSNLFTSPTHAAQRLIRALGTNPTQQEIHDLIPPEIRLGMKIDLNRMLGNGRDDDGDGVIDDPEELTYVEPNGRDDDGDGTVDNEPRTRERVYTGTTWEASGRFTFEVASVPRHQAGQLLDDSNGSRQRLAKDLYTLMMALLYDVNASQLYDFPDRPTGINQEDYTAWKIAQWAVNVVDFRDPDTIMTRFVYDARPFDGWDLSNAATTKVVFGMEAPELLLTESLNFHDRGVIDDPAVGGASYDATQEWANMPDDDMDQKRLPQGTTVLELYRPSSPKEGRLPGAASDQNPLGATPPRETNDLLDNYEQLNLAAEAPDGNPVFRVAISEPHPGGTYGGGSLSPLTRLADPDALATATFHTAQGGGTLPATQRIHMDAFNSSDNLSVDRVIWMTSRDPATIAADLPADSNTRNVYYNRFPAGDYANNAPYLKGGQYAVIGPRDVSFVGARTAPTTTNPYTYHSPQRLELTATEFRFYDYDTGANAGDPTDDPTVNPRYVADTPDRDGAMGPERIRPVVGIRAAANPPAGWTNPNLPEIGINISEPTPAANYYPVPDTTTAGPTLDAYTTPLDTPFDKQGTRPLTQRPEGQRTGTTMNFRTAFLQRLADPTMPYNADTNPYLTIDWMPMDLTVYNGEHPEDIQQDSLGVWRHIDADDPNPFDDTDVSGANGTGDMGDEIRFGSRYKSGLAVNSGGFGATPGNLIYSVDTVEPVASTPNPGAGVNFHHTIHVDADINNGGVFTNHSTTLGYLNHSFGTRWEAAAAGQASMVDWLGSPNDGAFPWLPWFNRPYSSPYEVMLVPASAPGRLGVEYILPGNNPSGDVADPFDGTDAVALKGHYGVLFNFLAYDEDTDGSGGDTRTSPNFYRFLQWLRTPQPYDNLERMMRPAVISTTASWPPSTSQAVAAYVNQYASELFHPPFNWIGPQERHGKINLNTIVSPEVYRSLMLPRTRDSADWTNGPFVTEFVDSRRGFTPDATVRDTAGASNPNYLENLNPDFPTPFAGAFQPAETGHIAPPLHTNGASASDPNRLRMTEKQVTLNREGTTTGQRVFEHPASSVVPANDPDRHAFFRHNEVTRLANLTSDNSNTFVVWVTVGLFEVDSANLNLLDEYGADQGTNKRYRAFYIIDRSVPVAYQPGRAHNVKNTVLFSRILN